MITTLIIIFFYFVVSCVFGGVGYILSDPYNHFDKWHKIKEALLVTLTWPYLVCEIIALLLYDEINRRKK